eukprot:g12688.t1
MIQAGPAPWAPRPPHLPRPPWELLHSVRWATRRPRRRPGRGTSSSGLASIVRALHRPTVNHGARAAYLAPHPPELRAAHVDHAGSAADGADRGVDVEQKTASLGVGSGALGLSPWHAAPCVSYVVLSNMQPILRQLDQYGYSQVDGFLGDANGYPEQIRAEMKSLFDKGFFEEDSDGRSGEERMEQLIQNQYEIAPTVVNFARSLLVSFARPLGELTESGLSNTKGISELFVLCGQGARYDRRVSNVYGWQTEQGFVRDPRKLVAIYFSNPNYREELGGVLQLEGVITPTGAVRISPVADRLVLFWADKTVWSMTPSRSSMISEHQYGIIMHMMAKGDVDYDPQNFARWFPELRDMPMAKPMKALAVLVVAVMQVLLAVVMLWKGEVFPANYWASFLESRSLPACVACLCILNLGKPYFTQKVSPTLLALGTSITIIAIAILQRCSGALAKPTWQEVAQVILSLVAAGLHALDLAQAPAKAKVVKAPKTMTPSSKAAVARPKAKSILEPRVMKRPPFPLPPRKWTSTTSSEDGRWTETAARGLPAAAVPGDVCDDANLLGEVDQWERATKDKDAYQELDSRWRRVRDLESSLGEDLLTSTEDPRCQALADGKAFRLVCDAVDQEAYLIPGLLSLQEQCDLLKLVCP